MKGMSPLSVKLVDALKADIFRWNRQINLVSRQETKDRLQGLFNQCVGGVGPVCDVLEVLNDLDEANIGLDPSLLYFDLGSGGGLPGVIWHILFSEKSQANGPLAGGSVRTWLVEPREKRAWFLSRLNRIPQMPTLGVLHGRWGEVSSSDVDLKISPDHYPVVVISLKALHLDDEEVLSGFFALAETISGSFCVVIARYYPPSQSYDADLVGLLKITEKGQSLQLGGWSCLGLGGSVSFLAGPGHGLASLVISPYQVHK